MEPTIQRVLSLRAATKVRVLPVQRPPRDKRLWLHFESKCPPASLTLAVNWLKLWDDARYYCQLGAKTDGKSPNSHDA